MKQLKNERDIEIAYVAESEIDDAIVVQIDSGDRTKRLRIMLNEAVLFDGEPEKQNVTLGQVFYKLSRFEADAHQLSLDIADLRGDVARQVEKSPGVKL